MSAKVPIALQLYSVRKDCEKSLYDVLKAVSEMGYAGVEFAGYYGHSAQQLKRMLDECNLHPAGSHIRLDDFLGPKLAETIEFNRAIGNRFLIVPGLPKERTADKQAWEQTAELFSGLSRSLRAEGMHIGYHNHMQEFQPLDGTTPWDLFFSRTDKDVVMQIDTGNALHGGGDPVACLRNFPGRALTVHLKEYSANNNSALVGEGEVDWQEVFSLCESTGRTQWYIVEQESYAHPPLECVARCLENLRKMGK